MPSRVVMYADIKKAETLSISTWILLVSSPYRSLAMAAAAHASRALIAAAVSCSLRGVGKQTRSPFSDVDVTSTAWVKANMAPGSSL
jgi:hypothetical protein